MRPQVRLETNEACDGRIVLAAVRRDELGYLLQRRRVGVFATKAEAIARAERMSDVAALTSSSFTTAERA